MYTITFWRFAKRSNSTARPSVDGNTFNCDLMDGSGIINPTALLDFGNVNPTTYNYAYIAEFSRYYYIRDWQYSAGLWYCALAVDVLATWRGEIGGYNTFIRRAAADNSREFPDSIYPHKTLSTISTSGTASPFINSLSQGTVVLGVTGAPSGAGVGATNYYAMSNEHFMNFLALMYSDPSTWLTITDITTDLQKALVNPIEYIASCKWFPIPLSDVTGVSSNIKLGWWEFPQSSIGTVKRLSGAAHTEYTTNVTIPKHPLAATRGSYMNLSPHSSYMLSFFPYGQWQLDTMQLVNYPQLQFFQSIDMIDGRGFMEVRGWDGTNYTMLDCRICNIAVPLSMAQSAPDISKSFSNFALSKAQNFFSTSSAIGGIQGLGAAAAEMLSLKNTADVALSSILPKNEIFGVNGGFNIYNWAEIWIVAQFLTPSDENPGLFGNVCNKNGQISSYPGYIEAEAGAFALPGTDTEQAEARRYIQTGFYYE